jgi:hypothetical protein
MKDEDKALEDLLRSYSIDPDSLGKLTDEEVEWVLERLGFTRSEGRTELPGA